MHELQREVMFLVAVMECSRIRCTNIVCTTKCLHVHILKTAVTHFKMVTFKKRIWIFFQIGAEDIAQWQDAFRALQINELVIN